MNSRPKWELSSKELLLFSSPHLPPSYRLQKRVVEDPESPTMTDFDVTDMANKNKQTIMPTTLGAILEDNN
jgi:hypothetical protein